MEDNSITTAAAAELGDWELLNRAPSIAAVADNTFIPDASGPSDAGDRVESENSDEFDLDLEAIASEMLQILAADKAKACRLPELIRGKKESVVRYRDCSIRIVLSVSVAAAVAVLAVAIGWKVYCIQWNRSKSSLSKPSMDIDFEAKNPSQQLADQASRIGHAFSIIRPLPTSASIPVR